MIAYMPSKFDSNSIVVLSTPEDWGLVQNSIRVSGTNLGFPIRGHIYHFPQDPWDTTFDVDGKTYSGFGWHVNRELGLFIAEHRKALKATRYTY